MFGGNSEIFSITLSVVAIIIAMLTIIVGAVAVGYIISPTVTIIAGVVIAAIFAYPFVMGRREDKQRDKQYKDKQ